MVKLRQSNLRQEVLALASSMAVERLVHSLPPAHNPRPLTLEWGSHPCCPTPERLSRAYPQVTAYRRRPCIQQPWGAPSRTGATAIGGTRHQPVPSLLFLPCRAPVRDPCLS